MPSSISGDDDFDSKAAFSQGQTWQNMTAQRTDGQEYTNNTDKAIEVRVISVATTSARSFIIDGNEVQRFDTNDASTMTLGGIVPAGSNYKSFNCGSAATWWELRDQGACRP